MSSNRNNLGQPEAANFCAVEEAPQAVSPWVFWPIVVSCSLVLTFAAYELAKLLPVIWRMS